MKLNNQQILEHYECLHFAFNDNKKYFPAKINYIIQKNIQNLKKLSKEIEIVKNNIVKHYGIQSEEDENLYTIPTEKRKTAQKELDDLLDFQQEINVFKIRLEDIEDLEFTSNQMEAIMFMIDEEAE